MSEQPGAGRRATSYPEEQRVPLARRAEAPEPMTEEQTMFSGRHVSIRTMENSDLAAVKTVNDDPVVRGNVVGWGWPTSGAEMARWFEHSQGGATHRWVVESPQHQVIGVTGLWDVDLHNRNAFTGLKLGGPAPVRGRGFGTDAIMLVMAFAFYDVGLERLQATILETNAASLRAYTEKCGMRREGLARRAVYRHGRWLDLHHVGLLREEFDALPDADFYVDRVTGGALREAHRSSA